MQPASTIQNASRQLGCHVFVIWAIISNSDCTFHLYNSVAMSGYCKLQYVFSLLLCVKLHLCKRHTGGGFWFAGSPQIPKSAPGLPYISSPLWMKHFKYAMLINVSYLLKIQMSDLRAHNATNVSLGVLWCVEMFWNPRANVLYFFYP